MELAPAPAEPRGSSGLIARPIARPRARARGVGDHNQPGRNKTTKWPQDGQYDTLADIKLRKRRLGSVASLESP